MSDSERGRAWWVTGLRLLNWTLDCVELFQCITLNWTSNDCLIKLLKLWNIFMFFDLGLLLPYPTKDHIDWKQKENANDACEQALQTGHVLS